ncbi:genetic competence negative regulator [Mesobacillus harenae]|uniref:genetic competence negative regulator n=1 Tax=Mesobacillus harenae TaxID=2213203 RepID=UPI001580E8D6|nr:genetic competence negative regulator [Mesobacillus harenae]
MRLERINFNKIKVFLTIDDLSDRGLTKEDIWKDSMKWHQLFYDMLIEASEEFDFEILGSVTVEIFSLQGQGMVMIVTMQEHEEEDEPFDDGFIEMQVTVEGSEDILFEFHNIEDVIQLSKRLKESDIYGGSLYCMNDTYYFYFEEPSADEMNKTVSILAEFGNPSLMSIHRILEYGKVIIKEKAVETLVHFFF